MRFFCKRNYKNNKERYKKNRENREKRYKAEGRCKCSRPLMDWDRDVTKCNICRDDFWGWKWN